MRVSTEPHGLSFWINFHLYVGSPDTYCTRQIASIIQSFSQMVALLAAQHIANESNIIRGAHLLPIAIHVATKWLCPPNMTEAANEARLEAASEITLLRQNTRL